MQYLYVFIGGAIGALLRYVLSNLNDATTFPTGTFIANLIGAFLMGFIGTLSITFFKNYPLVKKGLTTGLLGALTTFSTFQFELVRMFNQSQFLYAGLYAISSYVLGLVFCYCGVKLGGRKS